MPVARPSVFLLFLLGGTIAAASDDEPSVDACALLSKEQVAAVQGESVTQTKSSARVTGEMVMAQCFYTTATFSKSVSLMVTVPQPGGGARGPKTFWDERFHGSRSETGAERGATSTRPPAGGRRPPPPRPVDGIGSEAFWVGDRAGGALYVLVHDAFLRISVGGADDDTERLAKAKTLAAKVVEALKHRPSLARATGRGMRRRGAVIIPPATSARQSGGSAQPKSGVPGLPAAAGY